MPTIETKDGIFLSIPSGMDPNAPEVRSAVEQERIGRRRRRLEGPEAQAMTEAELAKVKDPTADMGVGQKVMANLGGGVMEAWTGAKDIFGKANDKEILDKRERDKALAQSTDMGILPDWMPTAGSALQVGGEMLPTLVPGGVGLRALPRVGAMMKANPVRAAMVGGGSSAALAPTAGDENRALNMGIASLISPVLPLAVRGIRAVKNSWTGAQRAGQELTDVLGEEAGGMGGRVAARDAERAGTSAAAREIPESLAEATGSVRAAQMESASGRLPEQTPAWAAFKREQNVARHGAVQDATQEAELLGQREANRAATTDPMRERALNAAGANRWIHQPVDETARAILSSDQAVNPAVRKVADYVLSIMDERAPVAVTARSLYEARKLLADKLHGPSIIGDEISNAVKGADRQTMELIKAIDETLNRSSRGRWQRYLDTYQRSSRPIDQSRAAQNVRDIFEREGVPELGGAPEVTNTRLGQALRASAGEPSRRFALQLSPSARGGLDDVAEQINRANEVQKARKLAGTAGGGSQTSTDLAASAQKLASMADVPGSNLLKQALAPVFSRVDRATQDELTVMLQNPQAAVRAIQEAQRLRQPLSDAQTALLQAAAQVSGGGLPRAMQSQQQR